MDKTSEGRVSEGNVSEGNVRNRAMICLCAAETVMMINTTAFNVALPNVSESLGASMAAQQWIVSSYNLTFAAVVLIAGFLGDRLGHLTTMTAGLAMFVIASMVGLFAGNIAVLLVARGIMGAGAGIVIPMGQALLNIMFRGKDLSRAMTAWAVAGTLGVPFGPVVGGAVTAMFGWRGIFGFDAVVFLAVMALIHATASKHLDSRQTATASTPTSPATVAATHAPLNLPWISVALMFAGFSVFSAGLIDAQHSIAAPSAWIPMIAGAVLITGFVAWDHHASNPLMELSLMHDPSFAANVPALLMLNFSMYGIIFIMPAYLETVMGHGALVGGLLLMPLVVTSIIGSLLNGRIIIRIGYRAGSIGSLIALALGMAAMGGGAFLDDTTVGWTLLIAGQIAAGLGLGAGQPAMLTWAMSTVPAEHSGAGSSLLTVFRQFGSIIGVGIFGSISGGVYATRFQSDASAAATAADPNPDHLTSAGSVNLDFQQAQRLTGQAAQTLRTVAAKAYESSMLASFLIAALVIAITTTAVAVISHKHNPHD